MTELRTLIGQSLMLSFWGVSDVDAVLHAASETRAGSVVLFRNNISDPEQVYELTRRLQAHARSLGVPPLLVAIDQEGGIVSRLPAPFVTVPSQMALAATGQAEAATEAALITGQQLRAVGINTNFAPSLDVNNHPANPVIGTRSFGSDPAAVARFGLAALDGYRDSGVIATVKHFPGHGDTAVDSHLGLPQLGYGRDRLDMIELAPFIAAFRAGVPAVMTAHIVFDAFDTLPATLSHAILGDLLRREFGYDGLVFTDALEMKAIADTYGPVEAALRSKVAGADVLLPMGTLDEQIAIAHALTAAVEAGRMERTLFVETARRIEDLRMAYGLTYDLPAYDVPDQRLYPRALELARQSITCLRGHELLPLARDTRLLMIDCLQPRMSLVEESLERASRLRDLLQAAFPAATCLALSPELNEADLEHARRLLHNHEVVLLVTRDAVRAPWQAQLAASLALQDRTLIHAAVRSPYDAQLTPHATVTLLTYGDPDVSLTALVDVLCGRAEANGVLPVTLTVV